MLLSHVQAIHRLDIFVHVDKHLIDICHISFDERVAHAMEIQSHWKIKQLRSYSNVIGIRLYESSQQRNNDMRSAWGDTLHHLRMIL